MNKSVSSCSLSSLRSRLRALQNKPSVRTQIQTASRLLLDASTAGDPVVSTYLLEQAEVEIHWAEQWG